MTLRSILYACASLWASVTTAQHSSIEWGPWYQKANNGTVRKLLSAENDAVHLFVERNGQQMICKLGPDLKTVYIKEVDEGMKMDGRKLVDVLLFHHRFVVFTYKIYGNTNRLFGRCYSSEDYAPLGPLRKIDSIPDISKSVPGHISVSVTEDEAFIRTTVTSRVQHLKSQTHETLLDEDLNEVPSRSIDAVFAEGPTTSESAFMGTLICTRSGRPFRIIQSWQRPERDDTTHRLAPTFWLAFINRNDHMWHSDPIDLGCAVSLNCVIQDSNNGDLYCAGVYPPIGRTPGGIFVAQLDTNDLHPIHTYFQETKNEIRNKIFFKNRKSEDDMTSHLFVDKILIENDSTVSVIAEWRSLKDAKNDGRGGYDPMQYIYDEIRIIKLSNNFSHIDKTIIIKHQHINDYDEVEKCSSIVQRSNNQNTYLVFNDTKSNLSVTDGSDIDTFKGTTGSAIATLAIVHPDGQYEKEPLLESEAQDALVSLPNCARMKDGRILVCIKKKKAYRFGWVTFH